MATDAKKHTTIAAGEAPTRAALAASILSINDAIPVANLTEAAQLAVAVQATGQDLATHPLIICRADARGLHRVEYSFDGTVWVPASGVLPPFVDLAARDAWTVANAGLLSAGDRCRVGAVEWEWSGAEWWPRDWAPYEPTVTGLTVGNGTLLAGFARRGQLIDGYVRFVAGTTSAATSTINISLPFAPDDATTHQHIGRGLLRLTNPVNNGWPIDARLTGGASMNLNIPDASSSSLTVGSNVTHLFPTGGAWGSVRPTFAFEFTYLAAA